MNIGIHFNLDVNAITPIIFHKLSVHLAVIKLDHMEKIF